MMMQYPKQTKVRYVESPRKNNFMNERIGYSDFGSKAV